MTKKRSWARALLIGFPFVMVILILAIPLFNRVRAKPCDKSTLNNLRQIASAAQQYMLDSGISRVTYTDVVGPDRYVTSLEPVAGETYTGIVVTTDTTRIMVTQKSGREVIYNF